MLLRLCKADIIYWYDCTPYCIANAQTHPYYILRGGLNCTRARLVVLGEVSMAIGLLCLYSCKGTEDVIVCDICLMRVIFMHDTHVSKYEYD